MPAISTEPRDVARQIGAGRSAFGLAVVAAPVQLLRLLGIDRGTAGRVGWLARLFGARDAALGIGAVLVARSGGDEHGLAPWLAAGAACDAVDALVLVRAARRGEVGGPLPVGIAVGAAGLAGLGAFAAVRAARA